MSYSRLTKEELASRLEALGDPALEAMDAASTDELRHDLQVHQIELEMQNRDLREAQAELEAARDRYAELYDFAPVGYATFDRRGVIVEINLTGAALLGRQRAQVVGQPFSRWLSGGGAAAFFSHVKNALQGHGRTVTELQVKGAAGSPLHLRLESAAVEADEAESGQQFRAALLDATEQRLTERKVLEDQALLAHMTRISTLGAMATGLAHELNQPLFAIRNFTEACLAQLEKAPPAPGRDAKLRKHLKQVAEQAERAGNIIHQMRDFVRKDDVQREPIDLNEVVSDAVSLLQLEIRMHKAQVRFSRSRSVPPVTANRVQIEQVMVNLVKNAIEACAECPLREVHIRIRRHVTGAEVTVQDSGYGLSPQAAVDLFHPFATTKSNGMGMGLAICRTIVEAHGGEIEAVSEPGLGATFRFTLPAAEGGDA